MDEITIKEWLDKLVDNMNERKILKDFNNQIRTDTPDSVLVFKGIDIIADTIGETLAEEKFDSNDGVCYEYSFVYREIKFRTFYRQRLPGFKEADQC